MYLLIQLVSRFVSWLPRRAALALGAALAWIFGSVVRFRRREVLDSMARCFPEKGRAELEQLASGMYRHLGLTAIEILRIARLGLADVEGRVQVTGEEHIARIKAAGQGALFLMGHIGNWELTGYVVPQLPQPVHVVVKPIRSPGASEFIRALRETLHLRPILWRQAFRECLRALKQHQSVAIILDQNTKRAHGLFVDFMGRTACTSAGLAILSAHYGLPVHPIYNHRRPDGTYEFVVLAPLAPPADKSPEALREATQRYTRALEDIIRRHPDQWLWLHRRWRTRPEPEPV